MLVVRRGDMGTVVVVLSKVDWEVSGDPLSDIDIAAQYDHSNQVNRSWI